ncbi:MAG TPA: hypothetical protein VF137_06235 [Candidatus Dormibacteraeota bacterium]
MALRAPRLVPLSTLAREGHAIMPEFWAQINEERHFVTAVLERTVVYVDQGEKKLIKRESVFVDPADIELREVTTSISWRSRGKAVAAAANAKRTAAPAAVEEAEEADEAEPEIEDLADEGDADEADDEELEVD